MPLIHKTAVFFNVGALVALGKQMIAAAEAARREPGNTFNPGPTPDGDPDGDWAAAGMLIGKAMHHLDESLPGGQKERTSAAMGALLLGTELLEAALARRGVDPSRLQLGDAGAQPPPPPETMLPPPHSRVFGNGADPTSAYVDQDRGTAVMDAGADDGAAH